VKRITFWTLVLLAGLVSCIDFEWNLARINPIDQNGTQNNSVNPSPVKLTTMPATDISNAQSFSGGNITEDGGLNIDSRGVCWSTSQKPTIANNKTTDGTGTGEFQSTITGLTQNTKYYVRAYAISSQGTTYGNEISFTTLPDPVVYSNNFYETQFTDNITGYTCGEGILLKTTNGGTLWTSIYESPTKNFTALFFINSETGFLGGNDQYYSYIYKTTDGGLSWVEIGKFWFSNEGSMVTGLFASPNGNSISALVNRFPNGSQVYGYLFSSINSGTNWTSSTASCSICGFDSGDVLNNILYIGGHLYWKYDQYVSSVYENSFLENGSNTITVNLLSNPVSFNDIDMISDYGYGVSNNGVFMVTSDKGKNWTTKSVPGYTSQHLTSVKFKDNEHGFIGTDDGRILGTNDSGVSWSEIYSGPDQINSIFIRSDDKLFITGNNGLIKSIN
jgi:photosystem II stability/assembly factor-like uncharacterized protein